MNKMRQWWVAAAGGVVLVAMIGAGAVMAQTPSATPGASSTPAAGTFKSNEDATHEKGETAAQEAAEDSGQGHAGFRGGKSNEDPTHEQSESADREAQEDAAQAAATPSANTN